MVIPPTYPHQLSPGELAERSAGLCDAEDWVVHCKEEIEALLSHIEHAADEWRSKHCTEHVGLGERIEECGRRIRLFEEEFKIHQKAVKEAETVRAKKQKQ